MVPTGPPCVVWNREPILHECVTETFGLSDMEVLLTNRCKMIAASHET